jgi:hypothetical protein
MQYLKLASTALALGVALVSTKAMAEPMDTPSPEVARGVSLSVTPVYQFESSLDSGGDVSVFRLLVNAGYNKALSQELGIGFRFAYDYADYHFSGPSRFGWPSPWSSVHGLEFGGSVSYDLTPEWSLMVAPSIEFSRADDAGWGNALIYGGVVTVTKDISKDLTLGLGVGAYSEIEKVMVFPMIVVNWKINDRMSLSNPFRPGPTGPAGLELTYRLDGGWDLGTGLAYRSNRFRLNRTGLFGDTIGESSALPAWVRLTRKMGKSFDLDLYAGAMLGGQMSIDNRNGSRLTSTNVDTAPFLALAVSTRF